MQYVKPCVENKTLKRERKVPCMVSLPKTAGIYFTLRLNDKQIGEQNYLIYTRRSSNVSNQSVQIKVSYMNLIDWWNSMPWEDYWREQEHNSANISTGVLHEAYGLKKSLRLNPSASWLQQQTAIVKSAQAQQRNVKTMTIIAHKTPIKAITTSNYKYKHRC